MLKLCEMSMFISSQKIFFCVLFFWREHVFSSRMPILLLYLYIYNIIMYFMLYDTKIMQIYPCLSVHSIFLDFFFIAHIFCVCKYSEPFCEKHGFHRRKSNYEVNDNMT